MFDSVDELTTLTAQIVAAYVGGQNVPTSQITSLIRDVHATLSGLTDGDGDAALSPPQHAVPIRESVFPDRVICLDCGHSATMLRRHLSTAHGLTPDQYRAKWSLPAAYPIVAPNYAKVRSAVATKHQLGKNKKKARRESIGRRLPVLLLDLGHGPAAAVPSCSGLGGGAHRLYLGLRRAGMDATSAWWVKGKTSRRREVSNARETGAA